VNPKLRVAVLVSGHGSNLQALIDACAAPQYPAEIVLVISNVPTAYAIQRATAAGLAVKVIDHRGCATREQFEAALLRELGEAWIEFDRVHLLETLSYCGDHFTVISPSLNQGRKAIPLPILEHGTLL